MLVDAKTLVNVPEVAAARVVLRDYLLPRWPSAMNTTLDQSNPLPVPSTVPLIPGTSYSTLAREYDVRISAGRMRVPADVRRTCNKYVTYVVCFLQDTGKKRDLAGNFLNHFP